MSEIVLTTAAALLVWMACLGAFLYALKVRWFARFEHGFFFELLLAVAGVAILVASILGIWGYEAAKQSVDRELIAAMRDIGGIVEAEVTADLASTQARLVQLADSLGPDLESAPADALEQRLRTIQDFDHRYLQLQIWNRDAQVLAATPQAQQETLSRVAVVSAIDEATPYVTDSFLSKAFARQVIHLAAPIPARAGPPAGAVTALFDVQTTLSNLVGRARFNATGYAVVVDGEGQILAHPDPGRLDEDVSSYPAVRLARESGAPGQVVARNARGVERLFVYRPMRNPSTTGREPWVLLTEIDEAEQLAILHGLRDELLIGSIALGLISLLVAQQVSRSLRRPLDELRLFARQIGTGDLTGHTSISGRDVAGALGTTLNDMVKGLRERDRVKEVFGRYIATQVSDKILQGQIDLGGEARVVTVLFSDIRNFTGMSEQMTPQQVVSFLNSYFSEMVDAVFEQGGVLDKFLGDGLMAVFGSLGDQPDHPRRAVLAALRMQALLAKLNGERAMTGKPPVAIGVGIHTDEVVVGNIGSNRRLEYTVIGDGVNAASRVQTLNKEFGTTILITETTYASIKDEFDCRPMPDHPLRGKHKPLKFYEVVSVRGGAPEPAAAV